MALTDLQSQIFGGSSDVLLPAGGGASDSTSQTLSTVGTVVGTLFGGPAGGAVGNVLGSLGGSMFGGGGGGGDIDNSKAASDGSLTTIGSISGKSNNMWLYVIIAVLAYLYFTR